MLVSGVRNEGEEAAWNKGIVLARPDVRYGIMQYGTVFRP